MKDYDGIVGIYSQKNYLSTKLEEKFREKYLDVKIFNDFHDFDISHFSYLIINLIDNKDKLSSISQNIKNLECKILVLHPLYVKKNEKFVSDSEILKLIETNQNLGVLLVPDVLGDNVENNPDSINKLVERIVRDTFSFGVSGQIIALNGPNIIETPEESDLSELYYSASIDIDFSLRLAIKNTKFKKSLVIPEIELSNKPVKKVSLIKYKKLLKIGILLLSLYLIPFILIITSALLLFVSSKTVFSNNKLSKSLINKSSEVSNIAKNLSLGNNFIYDTSNIVYKLSLLGTETGTLINISNDFVNKIMGDNVYDLSYYSNDISASLDKIHTEISFLQSDVNELGGILGKVFRNNLLNRNIDIGEYKNKIYSLKNFFSRISILLGNEKPQKYLVLFQNNMELRPTGGFIGSYALMTFDKGRLSEIVVNDVYTADGQLKGHVDPPEPIRKYLGEGGWFLRDSNWDPDFSVSAVKAEWFLEKELNEKVDGVIAIDLNFVKNLLEVTGPINLSDFGLTIDSNNIYQVVQSEVEDEFFPGSIKKASILTSLSRNLISEIENLKSDRHLNLFRKIYQSLDRKHLQIYLHDGNAQEAISNLGYSGEVNLDAHCGQRCLNDGYSLVDANLGVNKSNFFIKRSQELNLSVSKEIISHELFVTYENTASPAVGKSGVYKNYARILLPLNAKLAGVRIYETNGTYKELEYDLSDMESRIEAGFLFEILPSTQKRIQIVWSIIDNKFAQGGEYNLNIIKQAGTESDNLIINIRTADLVLTGRNLSVYNTTLARNFRARLFFRPF
ncbi:MAG: DUF4012 domain-containing protein [Candidatus Woesebacteria bacterium]|nr:DUF4012 domain-containing protein [Candidatus Woesebacteria bacterium]